MYNGILNRSTEVILPLYLALVPPLLETSHSLVCFTCKDASSNWGCLALTIFASGENYCVTTYLGAGIGTFGHVLLISISKGCASVCPSGEINIGTASASVFCCSSFLCNTSGASSVKVTYLVLAMAILATFIYIRAGL
uniref:UPAR/Ly6 domain-containing protein n=1 Tax=Chelonoidis abingdonii TaxID=106734 RepID=A0A8C0GT33_CHEAB